MEEKRKNYTVLIADDDINVHQSLGAYFRREGYDVVSAYNGEETIEVFAKSNPDVLILDIMMPRLDGLGVCREVRKRSNIPIIMLSAKSEEFDKLLGLEIGADDYITKPFSPREVLARVKVVLRRIREMQDQTNNSHLVVGNLDINVTSFTVKLNGKPVPCTPKEIEILYTFASNPGVVFSRENLLQSIWGYDYPGETRAVDSHIKRIRAKFEDPKNNWDIKTVWGIGYRFEINK